MKYIVMPETTAESVIAKLTTKLREMFAESRNIQAFTFNFKPEEYMEKANIILNFSPIAYLKQNMLVANHKDEIAWHGIVRISEDRKRFDIEDLLVYPQAVTGATVTTDEKQYQEWKNALDDDTYNNLRYQAHSHVRMAPNPSGVDTTLYDAMLSALGPDSYYIFLITNKEGAWWCNIYDMANNAIYEKSDIKLTVGGLDLSEWYDTQIKTHIATNTYTAANNWRGAAATTGNTTSPDEKKIITNDQTATVTSIVSGTNNTRIVDLSKYKNNKYQPNKFTYGAPYEMIDSSAAEADALIKKYEQLKKQGKANYPMYCIGCKHCRTFNPKKPPCKTCEVLIDARQNSNR